MLSSASVSAGRQGEMFGWAKPYLHGYCAGLWDIVIKMTCQLDVEGNKTLISKSETYE